MRRLCDELDNTTSLLDLALSVLAEVAGTDDEGDLGETALAENLGVAKRDKVEDRGGVRGALAGEVLLTLLSGDQRPELLEGSCQFVAHPVEIPGFLRFCFSSFFPCPVRKLKTYLVEVDDGLPELVLQLVEVAHTNLSEVTGMVLVDVGTVVVLTTGHTTTTGMLAVLTDTTVTGRDVTTAVRREWLVFWL